MRSLSCALWLVLVLPMPAMAQTEGELAEPETAVETAEISVAPAAVDAAYGASLGEVQANQLADRRLRHRQARIDEGIGLLAFALASVVVGGGTAIAGFLASPEDTRWMSIGIGTAGWGAINAIFSVILFDLGGGNLRDIEADRALRGRELDWAREDAARDSYGSAAVVAVNAGLDVFYITAGILLFIIGDQAMPDDQWLEGYGIAMASQGTALLVFDLTTWFAATARGDELRELFRDEALEE
jgi:hypothetical protein